MDELDFEVLEEAGISQELSIKATEADIDKLIKLAKSGKWATVAGKIRSLLNSDEEELAVEGKEMSGKAVKYLQSTLAAIERKEYEEAMANLEKAKAALVGKDTAEKPGYSYGYPAPAGKSDTTIKSLGRGRVGGYAVVFGDADHPDLSSFNDYFTKDTDFWLDKWSLRPMIYDHAGDEATADNPVVGIWDKAIQDNVGIWMEGQLSRAHLYRKAILQLIDQGVLALSTDSAPHLVTRRQSVKNTHEIIRWPILAASLTTTPAEPRLRPVEEIKSAFHSVGVELPNDWDVTEEVKVGSTLSQVTRGKIQAVIDSLKAAQVSLEAMIAPATNVQPPTEPVTEPITKKDIDEDVTHFLTETTAYFHGKFTLPKP